MTLDEKTAMLTGASSMETANVAGIGINIKRHPVCGRNFEYASEDLYVAGEIGAAYKKIAEHRHWCKFKVLCKDYCSGRGFVKKILLLAYRYKIYENMTNRTEISTF